MRWLAYMHADRKRRQRGGILSGLLIVVAFLSILIGALMTELTSAFLLSRTEVARTDREASVTSAVELAIHRLKTSAVPPVCAQDVRGPWYLDLNGNPTAVTQTCNTIVPDTTAFLAAGSYAVDGFHDANTLAPDQYVVGDSSGLLHAYPFGSATQSWSFNLGGPPTGQLLTSNDIDGIHEDFFAPVAMSGSGCGGSCVAMLISTGGPPTFKCSLPTATQVTAQPAFESPASTGPNFPDYAFIAGSGAGSLYVYFAIEDGNCGQQAAAALGGSAVGSPLVLPGTVTTSHGVTTIRDEIFVLVSNGTQTTLEHWRYSETGGNPLLTNVGPNLDMTSTVGGTAVGYALAPGQLNPGTTLSMIVAGAAGKVGRARISASNGPSYSLSLSGSSTVLPGGISRAPFWCACPTGNLIGVGTGSGTLYLLSPSLLTQYSYDGHLDGSPGINTTPQADDNGDWYFGADDGYAYDVEIPIAGTQLYKAARFGPGGAVRSSPIVDDCGSGPCIYFASSTAGYFAELGQTRILDVRACVSIADGDTTCAANPRLWASVEVGQPAVIGGDGVYVMGWSYYSP